MPESPFNRSRVMLHLGHGDVCVVDSFGLLSNEEAERITEMLAPLLQWWIGRRITLIQIGPEQNIWPDRQQPGKRRL